jgi:hypothetical protein
MYFVDASGRRRRVCASFTWLMPATGRVMSIFDVHVVTKGFQGLVDTGESSRRFYFQQRFCVSSVDLSRTARFERLNSLLSRGTEDLGASTCFIGGMP